MSKQETLISADKLLEWIDSEEASVLWEDPYGIEKYQLVIGEINAGTFSPDPVPTIKPGDRGLYSKYTVINNETGKEVEDCFVLKPTKDIAAREALRAYARELNGTLISDHIILWLAHLEAKDMGGSKG